MPPRYIAVPFSGTSTPIPIPNPSVVSTTISSSQINLALTYVGPPAVLNYNFEAASSSNGPFSFLASSTSPTFQYSGLLTATTYYFRGRVQVSDGRFSNYTNVASSTTLAAPPGQPQNVTALATGTTSGSATWSSVVQASSYNVYLNDVLVTNVPGTSFSFSSLSPSTFYTVNISGVNQSGEGPQSVDSSFTTQSQAQTGARLKWTPGHYAASDGRFGLNSTFSSFSSEITLGCKNQPWIKGFRSFIIWAAIDMGPMTFTSSVGGATSGTLTAAPPKGNDTYFLRFSNGNYRSVVVSGTACTWSGALGSGLVTTADVYRFSQTDQLLSACAGFGVQWGLNLVPFTFSGGTRGNDTGTIPGYILNGSVYGDAPDSNFGWWGGQVTGSTPVVGAYTACVYRPAIANRYALLGQALGAKYDASPNYEFLCDQENSGVVGPALARQSFGANNTNDPSYSDTQYSNSLKSIYGTWQAAHPTTAIIAQNTFLQASPLTQQLSTWLMNNGIDVGSADSIGQSYFDTHPTAEVGANWGLAAYAGEKDPSNNDSFTYSDRRGLVACSLDVEGPDIGNGSGAKRPNKPLDICVALNQTYKASRAFWSVVAEGVGGYTWGTDISPVLKLNPLTQTSYPNNYPQ